VNEAELKKLLDAAEKNPRLIAAAVSGLPEKVLGYRPAPDKWSILEVLGHLADAEIVYAFCLRQMLAGKEPTLSPVDQDAWARNLGYAEVPAPESIAVYGLIRLHSLRLLRNLKPGELEKGALHPELGRKLTVAEIVQRMAKHGTAHLEQIERLKQDALRK
jgi:hypothetical protein